MTDHVLISCVHVFDRLHLIEPLFERHGITFDIAEVHGQQLTEPELLEIIDRYDGVLAGDDEFTAAVIAEASRLRTIAKWGIGVDAIDLAAAAEAGVRVTNTPGVFGDEIADYALAYILMLLRRQHEIDRRVRAGEWPRLRGRSLAGLTLGIVGFGSSGRELARRALACRMQVLVSDIASVSAESLDACAVGGTAPSHVSLDELTARADVVSLHTPLTDATHHLFDAARLSAMRPGAMLVNVARGPVVDTRALLASLEEGHLAGAALDVFEREPLPPADPLLAAPGLILGSHNASNTREAGDRTTVAAAENLVEALGSP